MITARVSLDSLTLSECRKRLLSRQLTSVELLEAIFERLEATEPFVHAYVLVDQKKALDSAHQSDTERIAGNVRGVLHGLPVSVKDMFRVNGMLTRAGSQTYQDNYPGRTSPTVLQCQTAGAIIIGKLETHEFALGQNVPPTRNAWNFEHYPGGSSAGAGVAVAVGSALAALGTDSAGSVRKPAALNGVVGFKPSYGSIDNSGVIPLSPSLDHVGMLTRTVADSKLLFQVVGSQTTGDDDTPRGSASQGVAGLRLGICDYFIDEAHTAGAVRQVFDAAVDLLREGGAEVVSFDLPALSHAVATGLLVMSSEAAVVHATRLRSCPELYTTPTRVLLEAASLLPASLIGRAYQVRELIRRNVLDSFSGLRLDALIAPTCGRTSMRLIDMVPETDLAEYIHNTVVANLTGRPAITLPAGLTADGLPVGLQVTGRANADRELLRIAEVVETAMSRGYECPPHGWDRDRINAESAGETRATHEPPVDGARNVP